MESAGLRSTELWRRVISSSCEEWNLGRYDRRGKDAIERQTHRLGIWWVKMESATGCKSWGNSEGVMMNSDLHRGWICSDPRSRRRISFDAIPNVYFQSHLAIHLGVWSFLELSSIFFVSKISMSCQSLLASLPRLPHKWISNLM